MASLLTPETGSSRTLRKLNPSAETGSTFPALYLVRSSWLARMLARVTFAVLVIFSISLFFVPWQQTSQGAGRVVARDPQQRPQQVVASYDGVIGWIKDGLQEGAKVIEGERVMEIRPFSVDQVAQIQLQLRQLEEKRSFVRNSIELAINNIQLTMDSNAAILAATRSEIFASQAKWQKTVEDIRGLQAELKAKEFKFEGVEKLAKEGLKSELELREARADRDFGYQKVLAAEQTAEELHKLLDAKEQELESKIQQNESKVNESKLKEQTERSKLAEVEKEIQELSVKIGELDRLIVTAPRTGIIQSLQTVSGSDTVKKGDPLFTVVPESSDMAVELTIRGMDSPLVEVGDKVRLQFQGFPAIQWVGWPSAAVGTFGGLVNSVNPSDNGKGDFIVFVTPDTTDPKEQWPDNRYIRQGARANGWILLSQVTLGYELWRQLNGFPPMIDAPGDRDDSKSDKDSVKKPKLPK